MTFSVFFSLSFFVFLKKKKRKKKGRKQKEKEKKSARKAQSRSTKLKGGSWWHCQRRERVGQRPAETQGRGRGGLWDRLFLRFVCV